MYEFVVYIYRYIYICVFFCDPPKDVAICVYMCVECVYLCVVVCNCVVFCVNMCQLVSYCVVLCVFLCVFLCVLCVLCVFVRISASRIAGCVFPRPKLRYSSASRMSYLLRCQFRGVQNGGCVYMYVFGGVSIWGYSVSICVNCVYSCGNPCVYCVYCVYLYVFWCGIV